MNTGLLGKSVVLTWAGYGVVIDNIVEESDKLTVYISVPKDTIAARSVSATGEKMCGAYLANRLQTTLNEITGKKNTIMFKIRNEVWDDQKGREAVELVKTMVR